MENPTWEVIAKNISRDGYGFCVVGQLRHDQERLLWAWEDSDWQHFCVTNKKSTLSKQGQTALQADVRSSQNSDVISRVWLWNASASPSFFWPSTLGLLFASENETWTTTEVIWKQQWGHGGCWRLLRGACFSLVFLTDRKTRISLAKVSMSRGTMLKNKQVVTSCSWTVTTRGQNLFVCPSYTI